MRLDVPEFVVVHCGAVQAQAAGGGQSGVTGRKIDAERAAPSKHVSAAEEVVEIGHVDVRACGMERHNAGTDLTRHVEARGAKLHLAVGELHVSAARRDAAAEVVKRYATQRARVGKHGSADSWLSSRAQDAYIGVRRTRKPTVASGVLTDRRQICFVHLHAQIERGLGR